MLSAQGPRRHGQSIVELSLLLPVLLMLIFGLVDFALAYNTHIKIRNAVAEGGYYIAQNPGDEAGARSQIRHELRDLQPALSDAEISITLCTPDSGGFATTITVNYGYRPIFGLFGIGSEHRLRNQITVPQFGGCR